MDLICSRGWRLTAQPPPWPVPESGFDLAFYGSWSRGAHGTLMLLVSRLRLGLNV